MGQVDLNKDYLGYGNNDYFNGENYKQDCIDEVYDRIKDNLAEEQFEELTESEKQELIAGHSKINLNGGDI